MTLHRFRRRLVYPVETHVKSVFRKMEVSDRVEAVREAIARGLLRD